MQVNQDPTKPKSSFVKKITREAKFIVSSELYSRISLDSLDALNSLIESKTDLKATLDSSPEEHRRRELLRLGCYYFSEPFSSETGLTNFNPPQSVHAMVRDAAYCGDLYYVDLIAEMLDGVGASIKRGENILDFGASSGRIIKTLSTVYSEANFYGCDPNEDAIKWASENINKAHLFVSSEFPPLPVDNDFFDIIYAVSIWSHFSESSALAWMEEMHRIAKPGAYFIWTTHGFGSLAHYWKSKKMNGPRLKTAEEALERDGFHFIDVFSGKGDWGVGMSNWGQTFINPIYVLKHMLPIGWKLCTYAHRRSEANQDVYLFQKI